MLDFRPILFVNGILLTTLATVMMLPAIVDLSLGHDDWLVFAIASLVTLFVGVAMAVSTRTASPNLNIRQAFLMTNLAWILFPAFAALPMMWSALDMSFTDAFFEAMSGLTTTGATVITGLDNAPPGVNLWRGLLQWLGGLGIIVMAIAVLPMLQIGGMQLFRVEAFDTSEKILPRAAQISGSLVMLYVLFTIACAAAYYGAGMDMLDAAIHSMTTLSTGGFSSHDASFAHFNSATIETIAIVFMIAGSLPFILYVKSLQGYWGALWRDSQVRVFFYFLSGFSLLAFASQYQGEQGASHGMRDAIFNVVSIMTTTGYATADYGNWGPFAVIVFFTLIFVGGCTASTSGGVKIFRFQVLIENISQHLRRVRHPHGVFINLYDGKSLPDHVSGAVLCFFFLYFLTVAAVAALLSLQGLDVTTALSSAATTVSNVGPGLGSIVGPAGNFATLSDSAKWILSVAMLLGRLELFTVLVLFMPAFWRH